ncbi:MAG: 3-hydroxyacyl-CoA dehydrogenase, partial [Burkholderiaceae bacterium]|nr:3-hydroxyacyl-CoA dehydrogenase [Burkholderiaceae bacterium]
DYAPGKRDAIPNPMVEQLVEDYRKEQGMTPRQISDAEIVQRLVYALVNEGARILEDGIASKSSDIDVVYLTGYGFPVKHGGPMHYASQVGLYDVMQSMRRFARNPRDDARFWEPAALIQKLVAEGKSFA